MYDVISEIRKLEEKYGEDFNWGTELKNVFFENELKKEAVLAPSSNVKAIARSYSKLVSNKYEIKKKTFDIIIKQTDYDQDELNKKNTNIEEFFDVIDW